MKESYIVLLGLDASTSQVLHQLELKCILHVHDVAHPRGS